MKTFSSLQTYCSSIRMADIQVNNLVFHMSKIQAELDETKRKLKQEKEEKERVLTRLSSIAGSKLTHNNPGIADLSDKNRPQKLGEYFSELYDNEWTEAVSGLTEGHEEEVAIQLLRDVLKCIAIKTKDWASKQYKSLQEALFQRDLRDSEAGGFVVIYKKITELQKEVSKLSIANAKRWLKEDEEFITTYKDVLSFGEPYIDRSVELCWTMQIQDPPMHLEFDSSADIDKSVFRLFTRNGNTLDFVVWPALMLHENGPLVHKGVVQPLPKKEDFTKMKDRKT